MDAFGLLVILVLACGVSANPMVEEPVVNEELKPAEVTTPITTTEVAPVELKNCTTAREVAGSCVARQFCDHGTPAIDSTLFAPRGYVSPCKAEEVCCPFDSIVQGNSSNQPAADNGDFDFGDDD